MQREESLGPERHHTNAVHYIRGVIFLQHIHEQSVKQCVGFTTQKQNSKINDDNKRTASNQ